MKKNKFVTKVNQLIFKGIAHRGLHNKEFTENGLKAFQNAIDSDVAFELDVHLSKDGVLVVAHDDDLFRVSGKRGIIEELTIEEIKNNYTLLDGESIPTLQEVLTLNNEKVPLVIELKVRNNNYKALANQLIKELKNIKDTRNFHLISFDPRVLFIAKKTKITTALLICKEHFWTYKLRYLFDGLDVEDTLINHKGIRKYKKNHFLNVWTIETIDSLNKVVGKVDTITFQHLDPKLIKDCL